MNDEDRRLLRETLAEMGDLKVELGEFRGEMREFKESTIHRVRKLEENAEKRQTNPETCVTGRSFGEHLAAHGREKKRRLSIIGLIVSGLGIAAGAVAAFFKK